MKYFLAKKIIFLVFIAAAFYGVAADCLAAADSSPSTALSASPDAIAIRIMPNPNHFSAVRWYKENIKDGGSPQNTIVDGYQAVRDGRTVYASAANIAGGNFYTNIYLISYSQRAESQTIDIFGQILKYWKLNSNIYSREEKDKIRRDTKRLADLADLNSSLTNYYNKNKNYPKLAAGSYLSGKTVSVWPSWQATLGATLGATLPVDPINKLTECRADCCAANNCLNDNDKASCGYEQNTCWNQTNKTFYFDFTGAGQKSLSGSSVYYYKDNQFFVNLETK